MTLAPEPSSPSSRPGPSVPGDAPMPDGVDVRSYVRDGRPTDVVISLQ